MKASVPHGLTGRTYFITSITWNAALGSPIWIPLIGALALTTPMAALIKLWKMIRCCFKIDFKMTSSQYHQGSAMVGWLPCIVTGTIPTDIQSLSAYNATVLSASKQESCSLTIPFLSPNDWFETAPMTGATNEHASVFFCPINPLLTTNASIPAVVPIEVWATIEDMDLSGAQSQMASRTRPDKEASKKEQQGKDAAVGSVIRNTSQLVRRIPVIGGIWSPIADVINTIFSTELSKPVSSPAPKNVMQRYYDDVNQSDGLCNATQMSLYQNPRTKVAPVHYGMDTSFMSIRKIAGTPMLFDIMIFDSALATQWSTLIAPNVVGAVITGHDYLSIMMRMFRFYRGSIKYLLHFVVPAFYSVRMRIFLTVGGGTPVEIGDLPNIVVDIKGDTWIPLTVPIISYTAWVDKRNFSTQIHPTLWVVQVTDIIGAPSPTTSIMYMNVYRAGGEDMQFALMHDPLVNSDVSEKQTFKRGWMDLQSVKKQMNIKKKFEETFEPLVPGHCFTEEYNAVMAETVHNTIDILKRAVTGYTSASFNIGVTSRITNHQIIANMFLFWRGSRVCRHMHLGNSTTHNDGWYMDVSRSTTNVLDGGWAAAYNNPSLFQQTEAINVPYFAVTPYCSNPLFLTRIHAKSVTVQPIQPILAISTPDTVTVTAGDDFEMLFLVPWANQLSFEEKKYVTKHVKHA